VRRRLVVSYIGLVVLVLVILEVPLGLLAARHERGLTLDQAERDAAGLAVLAGEVMEGQPSSQLSLLATRYRNQSLGEVIVLDRTGRVIATAEGDNDTDRDASGDGAALVSLALAGRTVSAWGTDEGSPWAGAAAPIMADNRIAGAVLIGIPADSTEDRIHKIWLALGLFGIGTIVFTVVVALLLARSLTRPLALLEGSVAEFAGGRLDARADEEVGPLEIRTLAGEFNTMASRLHDLIEAQNRFVSDASHQLRSPLTALRLRLENLEASADRDSAEGIAAAGREVSRLSRIVDGLLALGRASASPGDKRLVGVAGVVAERCEAWSALAEERSITLVGRVDGARDEGAVLVPGDLEQILDNLLANAIEAVPPGGSVRVAVIPGEGRRLEVHVVDDGPGMSEADRRRAFDRFWQGPATGPGSSGLGLAIVEQLVHRNDATVELRQADPTGLDAVVVLLASRRGMEEPDRKDLVDEGRIPVADV
jgi:signal transduction histidine kinase